MEFYDIHSHIVFGVDDGAADYETACKMAVLAYKEGVRHICATPHYNRRSSHHPERLEKMREHLQQMQQFLKESYPDMHLYPGNEVMYYSDIERDLEAGRIMTLNNSRYMLIEFKPEESYRVVYNGLQQVLHMRYIPVLAHIERLDCLYGEWNRLDELREAYVVLQMNTSSLMGSIFSSKVRYARRLVEEGYIDVLGTDMHNTATRAPKYKEAAEWIRTKCGRSRMRQLVHDNAEAILANRTIDEWRIME